MTWPQEYQRAAFEFERFMVAARDAAALSTTNQSWTMAEAVLRVFRRRLTVAQAIVFGNALPPLLRAVLRRLAAGGAARPLWRPRGAARGGACAAPGPQLLARQRHRSRGRGAARLHGARRARPRAAAAAAGSGPLLGGGTARLTMRRLRQAGAVTSMTFAWILPSTSPPPKRCAMAAVTASVARARPCGSRASISLRRGVPWQ